MKQAVSSDRGYETNNECWDTEIGFYDFGILLILCNIWNCSMCVEEMLILSLPTVSISPEWQEMTTEKKGEPPIPT